MKIGRNASCLCGSGKKYKQCCWGKVDWAWIDRTGADPVRFLSGRGKNLLFLEEVAGALQLDSLTPKSRRADFKRAFTADAVKKIFEAELMLWPDRQDVERILVAEQGSTSGLYLGFYDPERILTGITRHSLYADKLLIVDPLPHPAIVADQYNPLTHPDQYRTTALRWVTMWLRLVPWIQAGWIQFVRTPGDLDARAQRAAMEVERQRYASTPELEASAREFVEETKDVQMGSYMKQMFLSMPNDEFLRIAKHVRPSMTDGQLEALLRQLEREREEDPFYVETLGPKHPEEIIQVTVGTNHEMAKETARLAGAHFVTDLSLRWKEIELDRKADGVDEAAWSPFAKAFQDVPFNYLNAVPVEAALALRQEGRLERMRHFLRKAWIAVKEPQPFSQANAVNLAAELRERVDEAEAEWDKIGREAVKWVGAGVSTGLLALSSVAIGGGALVSAGLAAAAITGVVVGHGEKAAYRRTHPAAFFLDLQSGKWRRK